MITVNQQALNGELAKLGGRIAWYVDKLQLGGQAVVRRQAGLLTETMMKITPRADPKKIEADVLHKFTSLNIDLTDQKAGPSGVKWYAFQPNAIFGVVADKDMTGAEVDDLLPLYYKTRLNKQGRTVAGKRGKQTVYLWQKIVTKMATVKKLAARLKRRSGRQKAGNLPSWETLKSLGFRSTFTPPKYITDNAQGARGASINGLGSRTTPEFSIINSSKGSGSQKMLQIAKAALEIRIKAMEARMAYLVRYPEKLSEEQ